MRLIDADELIEEFEWLKGVVNKYNRPHIEETIERINEAPTVDAVPVVHGRWIFHDDGAGTCNQCGIRQSAIWDYDNSQNFCGHCGAKMDRKEQGDE